MGVRIVVLASGRGSNFAAIADAARAGEIPGAKVIALICNKAGAPVIAAAAERGIDVKLIESKRFHDGATFDRNKYETALHEELERLSPDLICLAGYMLLLGSKFVARWRGKIINIHPSLLPAFKGLRPQKQALDAGAKESGCTVHYVTEEMDCGASILQARVPIHPQDDEATLSARILKAEHRCYIEALKKMCLPN